MNNRQSRNQRRRRLLPTATLAAVLALSSIVSADIEQRYRPGPSIAAADLDRGRQLYEVGCDACHSANVHWRNHKLVDSWPSLVHQVDRWQRISSQKWQPSDISDVAAYLNHRFYHLECPANECAARQAALSFTSHAGSHNGVAATASAKE